MCAQRVRVLAALVIGADLRNSPDRRFVAAVSILSMAWGVVLPPLENSVRR
jgi:hypothetical protein